MTGTSQNKIKQIRERLGLSQKAFADKLGITKGYLSAIESNKRKPGRKIFEGIIQECLDDLVAVYGGTPETETVDSQLVAEPGPDWKQFISSIELSPQEEALILAIRSLGSEYAKDLYYSVMSQLRKGIQEKEVGKETLTKLHELIRILGKAAID